MRMDKITDRLPGIISMHMMTSAFLAKHQQEHNENLLQLMETASINGLVFHSSKCHISQATNLLLQ